MSTQTQTRIPRSTLTSLPCTGHDPGDRCIECVGEGELQVRFLAPDTEEETR